ECALSHVPNGGHVGHSWHQLEHAALFRAVRRDVARHFRTGAHEAHFADQHVEQLRQLIELRATEPAADASHARIAFDGEGQAAGGGVAHHRAELPNAEGTAAVSHALLPEEDGTAVVPLHQKREYSP